MKLQVKYIMSIKMYINADKVTCIHVEPTSRCNAMCPGCPRNNNGFGVREDLIIRDLNQNIIIDFAKNFPALQSILLCGNLGDPIAYKHLDDLFDKIIAQNKIQNSWSVSIQTNGSLRSTNWWERFGKKCSEKLCYSHTVVFGIDGLEDTNHIYRQATSFNKIIDNAKAFINAGGYAEWQYLIFEHNQHQIKQAKQLASDIGFSNFFVKQPWFSNAFHWKTGEKYYLKPTTRVEYIDRTTPNDFATSYDTGVTIKNNIVESKNCMHIDVDGDNSGKYSMFLAVDGKVMPCCHFSDKLPRANEVYDIETLDINNEIAINSCRLTCRTICGSKI